MNKKIIIVIIYSLLIFSLGFIIGILTAKQFIRPPDPAKMNKSLLRTFKNELNLNYDQAKKVENILNSKVDDFINIRDNFKSDFESVVKSIRDEIETVLTDEQKIIFKNIVEQHDEKRKKHHKN